MKFSDLLLIVFILGDVKSRATKKKSSSTTSSFEIDEDALEELFYKEGGGVIVRQMPKDVVWDLAGRKTLITTDMLTEEYSTFRITNDKETNIPLIKDPENNELYVVIWSITSPDIELYHLNKGPNGEFLVFDDDNTTMLVTLNKYSEVVLKPYIINLKNHPQVVKI